MGFLLLFLVGIAAVCVIIQWLVIRPESSNELPPLVIPLSSTPAGAAPTPPIFRRPAPASASASASASPADGARTAAFQARDVASFAPPSTPPTADQRATQPIRRDVARDVARDVTREVVRDFNRVGSIDGVDDINRFAPSETVRFRRPVDEPVQLLPGRLEVLAGDRQQQEIRFVRIAGRPAELILGRDPGDSPQHVTLKSSTVSRQHARFAFVDGAWTVSNLSHTNPVVVNDEELPPRGDSRRLADGDRLEMGEVVLRFHAR